MKAILMLSVLFLCAALTRGDDAAKPRVVLQTNQGNLVLELEPESAPVTVDNFLGYVDSGHYDGTIFHRVVPGFMIQGGGFTAQLERKPIREPIENEAANGLKNARGTIAMARTNDPHSATDQFFINVVDNWALDHRAKDQAGWGYAVFGSVVEGMEVADAIVAVRTAPRGPHRHLPVEPVVIERAYRSTAETPEATSSSSDG
jgi:cyclophilin family peptidyl-prolyl cis-trans isomerase